MNAVSVDHSLYSDLHSKGGNTPYFGVKLENGVKQNDIFSWAYSLCLLFSPFDIHPRINSNIKIGWSLLAGEGMNAERWVREGS